MSLPDSTTWTEPAPTGIGWNPAAAVRCMECGDTQPMGPWFGGCPRCAAIGSPAPLEVVYSDRPPQLGEPNAALGWLARHRQPIPADRLVTLGRNQTPLAAVAAFGRSIYVKNETVNPTWSHKDRLHEVGVGVAKMIGARGVVASSTGNHGAAAAAHAAAAGLPAAIFCHPEASAAAMQMIAAYGGLIAQFDPDKQHDALVAMVDNGWFPATSMDPLVSGRCNPYGAEGYKSIAYEIVAALGDTPDAIIVPTASGDTLYGVAKGFAEVTEVTGLQPTRIVAAQPQSADPLRRSMQVGSFTRAPGAHSVALSVADAASGRHAMAALRRWNGETVTVSEEGICDATLAYARSGLLVEPASAVSLAGSRQLLVEDRIDEDAHIVLLATCAGIKWPRELATMFPVRPLRDADQLRGQVGNLR